MREPKNQMLGTMEPLLMQLSVKETRNERLIPKRKPVEVDYLCEGG